MKLTCDGCGTEVVASADNPFPFRCPRSGDGGDHVLVPVLPPRPFPASDDHPFLAFRTWLASWALCAETLGDARFVEIVLDLDARVAAVDGAGFRQTPFRYVEALGVWVKDETHDVAGSHKARHLMGIALYLQVVQALGWVRDLPRLAIASCGNAALAAAVLARAAEWPLSVFVPATADPAILARLRDLGAEVTVCERDPDRPGDPSWHRFERAVARGALPFCVQGPANGLTLEGGETLAFEMGRVLHERGVALEHLVVQVGGGALASACARGFERLAAAGVTSMPRIDTVQTEGGWPLKRACDRVRARAAETGIEEALHYAAAHRAGYMWPWETEPRSIATGILDDETWDWHHVVAGMLRTGGEAFVVSESALRDANARARRAGFPATPTGTAGLAAVPHPHPNTAVLLTGGVRT